MLPRLRHAVDGEIKVIPGGRIDTWAADLVIPGVRIDVSGGGSVAPGISIEVFVGELFAPDFRIDTLTADRIAPGVRIDVIGSGSVDPDAGDVVISIQSCLPCLKTGQVWRGRWLGGAGFNPAGHLAHELH